MLHSPTHIGDGKRGGAVERSTPELQSHRNTENTENTENVNGSPLGVAFVRRRLVILRMRRFGFLTRRPG
jgi:hypothetical protein